MGGVPVFADTRVPVQTLMDYLEAGDSINDFLRGYPTVKREQVIAFLEEELERVRRKIARLGVGEKDVEIAVRWARKLPIRTAHTAPKSNKIK